jgi:hypothetical protein
MKSSRPSTLHIAASALFSDIALDSLATLDDRIELSYKRAKAIAKVYGNTSDRKDEPVLTLDST